ncbi:MAG TPA: hypothetical protein PLQ56_18335 [Aggregatilineales bacterium]|nr:hypothetical protein [Aggregatilineales bacterium]
MDKLTKQQIQKIQAKLNEKQLRRIRDILFNSAPFTEKGQAEWRTALLEQYKLYVEMADKVSERRNTANSFFLTANTLLITIFSGLVVFQNGNGPQGGSGISIRHLQQEPLFGYVMTCVTLAGMALCITWIMLISRYKNLNRAKFIIIQQLEEHLPAKPYTAEDAVPAGRFKALTNRERVIPFIFIILYTVILAGLLFVFLTQPFPR